MEHRRLSKPGSLCGWIARAALALSLCLHLAADPTGGPDFSTEVRPILSQHCFKCHGPDDQSRKSNLRLDVRDAALQPAKSGAVALVPGKPHSSELVTRIHSRDPDEVMPPPSTRQPLTDKEKKTLEAWIAAGAEYVPHWAFQRPKFVTPPQVDNAPWARNQLLASPRYGERWGRRWMDLARYADTNGYEKDRTRSIWPWRDWVIRSLNADMPFDQFTLEQLAGDLLPNATPDQRIATGFHRNTMLNEEGGIDPLEFRFHAMTDRVATTGTTWLGLTVGCAQCHTHKYDPIPHREYYQLMAFLNNADEPDMDLVEPSEEARYQARLAEAEALTATLAERFPIEETVWFTPALTEARSLKG
ncbi:MAG: DUF1549 domain-containing protein, partial [Verrucomicrobia bacterium]|nr:DUF1549 domain-containing protein [Verrucomicrobiota bacterium]